MTGPRVPFCSSEFSGPSLPAVQRASRNAHRSLPHDLGNRRKCFARQFWDRFPVLAWGIPEWSCPGTVAGATHHDASHHAGHFMRFAEIVVNPWHSKDVLECRATLGIVG